MTRLALLAALLLAGCATTQPRIVTKEVKVPVSVPCAPTIPEQPTYAADQVSLEADIFQLVQALLIDREQRRAREAELEAAANACR